MKCFDIQRIPISLDILFTADYQKDEIFFTIRDFYFVFDNVSDTKTFFKFKSFCGCNGKYLQTELGDTDGFKHYRHALATCIN